LPRHPGIVRGTKRTELLQVRGTAAQGFRLHRVGHRVTAAAPPQIRTCGFPAYGSSAMEDYSIE
jgi:hypothetical protein